jgi:hypothetical protein
MIFKSQPRKGDLDLGKSWINVDMAFFLERLDDRWLA